MKHLYAKIEQDTEVVRAKFEEDEQLANEFNQRLDLSWIYHDNALEGIVLSYHELNAAIDDRIISDSTLIPTYDDVQNHRNAIDYVRMTAIRKKPAIGLEFLKKVHQILSHEPMPRHAKSPPKPTPGQYRKDNPLHRLYFHEIAPPEKISYQMRKLIQWFTSAEAKKMHAIKRAAFAHHKLISIYPWPRHSGKVARLLMNAILMREGLVPAVIHGGERQRYYERLRQPPTALTELVVENISRTLGSVVKFVEGGEMDGMRAAS